MAMTDPTKAPCYVSVKPSEPWFIRLKVGYSKELTDFCWERPGCKWDKVRAIWNIPVEFAVEVLDFVRATLGLDPEFIHGAAMPIKPEFPEESFFENEDHARRMVARVPRWMDARAYQRRHAWAASTQRIWIDGSEMGVGKAVIAMLTEQLRGGKTGVVVDTAGHRADWYNDRRRRKKLIDDEFGRWWPDHPQTKAIETRADARNTWAPIRIVSYNLLPDLVKGMEMGPMPDILTVDGEPPRAPVKHPLPDFVWFDEAHMLQNPDVDWSRAARKLVHEIAPKTNVLAMTGTLIPDNIMTVFNILDTLWPGRFGNKFDFGKVYSVAHTNDFGKSEYWGTNDAKAPELSRRLGWMSLRKTKKEIAHLLPPFDVRPRWIDDGKAATRENEAMFFAQEAFANGAHHVTLVTHHRHLADSLCVRAVMGEIPYVKLTGELTPSQRSAEIRRAKDMPRCLIVATLHAITTGVNLSFSPDVCFAEIYPRVVDMVQVLGRFHRMTSTEKTSIRILAVLGGDPLAELLMNKLKAVNAIMKPGVAESELGGALDELATGGLTREQVNDLLRGAASNVSFDEFT